MLQMFCAKKDIYFLIEKQNYQLCYNLDFV
nr:MAG TPA: hypothetical protein [Caudoviricetes sp.]DAJ80490.1 MAG TPA: hypothetical protein [Caudoviricetes sp.]